MYASKYVFGRGFFVAWVVISIIWVWGTMLIAGFYPIIDGWRQLRQVYYGLTSKINKVIQEGGTRSPPSDASVFIDEEK